MTLSLITIVRNHAAGFRRTARSVMDHAPDNAEWVVIDGASTDGTGAAIAAVAPRIATHVSEPDRGIADAFNKGVARASGEYVLFLNAGDCLAPGAAFSLARLLDTHRGAPVIVGRIELAGRRHGRSAPFWRQYLHNQLPHQAMLIRRDLFATFGTYDRTRHFGMDYEWSLRLCPVWRQIVFVNELLTIMEPGGISIANAGKTLTAYHHARVQHFGLAPLSLAVLLSYQAKRLALRPFKPALNAVRARHLAPG